MQLALQQHHEALLQLARQSQATGTMPPRGPLSPYGAHHATGSEPVSTRTRLQSPMNLSPLTSITASTPSTANSIANAFAALDTLRLAETPSTAKAQSRKHVVDLQAVGPLPEEVNEIRGQVIQLSKTQAGSKYLQRQLLKGQSVVVDLILEEIEQDIVQLMCDAYGNYLCSQAFQACSIQQRKRLLEKLSPKVAATACDKRGTHALQALIGLLTTPDEQDILARAISLHVIELCMDANGTHVIQRLLFCFTTPFNDFIYKAVVDHMLEVAHHPHGLCVLKKCISQAKTLGRHQAMLVEKLAEHALDLVQSPYGNYAIQHALEEWGGPPCTKVLQSLEGRMMQLSIQKFSSNVVDKIFCVAPPELRYRFIDELIHSDKMSVLVNSNYGHYVVKRALQLAEPPQVQALLDTISTNLAQLPNRRLRAKWEKVMSAGSERLGDNRSALDLTAMLEPAKMVQHDAGMSAPFRSSAGGKRSGLAPGSPPGNFESDLSALGLEPAAPSLSLQQRQPVWGHWGPQEQ